MNEKACTYYNLNLWTTQKIYAATLVRYVFLWEIQEYQGQLFVFEFFEKSVKSRGLSVSHIRQS